MRKAPEESKQKEEKMFKKTLIRGVSGFCYSSGIMVVFYTVMIAVTGITPLVPSYAAMFENEVLAMMIQLLLIGLMSAVFAAGTVILEIERLGLLAATVIYMLVPAAVWIPVGIICFGLNEYIQTMVVFSISYVVSFAISFTVEYRELKKNIKLINEKLEE